jgi:hypothetical protein
MAVCGPAAAAEHIIFGRFELAVFVSHDRGKDR